jgi:hypothetical protein
LVEEFSRLSPRWGRPMPVLASKGGNRDENPLPDRKLLEEGHARLSATGASHLAKLKREGALLWNTPFRLVRGHGWPTTRVLMRGNRQFLQRPDE